MASWLTRDALFTPPTKKFRGPLEEATAPQIFAAPVFVAIGYFAINGIVV